MEKVGEGPISEGTRFRGRYKSMGEVELRLAEYEPPRRVAYRWNMMNGRMNFDNEFLLGPYP